MLTDRATILPTFILKDQIGTLARKARGFHHHRPVALRGGGVSCPGLSLVFEYTVFQRGWSRIASDVFRLVRRALRDAVALLFVGNTAHPGLYLTFGWYHPARTAFSTACSHRGGCTGNMDLHILDHRLRVTSIAKNGLVNFTHPLIKLIFLRNRTR